MELKDKLPKQVYDDLLVMLGKSYLPSNDQGEDDQQNSDLRKSFREHILPRIVAKIDEIAKIIKSIIAIKHFLPVSVLSPGDYLFFFYESHQHIMVLGFSFAFVGWNQIS